MASFYIGKWKLTSSDNFDEYMKTLGVGFVIRNMANNAHPVQDIKQEGDEITIKTSTTFRTTEIKFKFGVEFDEETADGRIVKTTVTQDGNKLIQSQKSTAPKVEDRLDTVLVREFNGDEMKMVLTVKDVVSTRVYKKIE